MAFSQLDIVIEFVEASQLIRIPKLKRRWWWKPNSQLSAMTWRNEPSRIHDHQTFKVWCAICNTQGNGNKRQGGWFR